VLTYALNKILNPDTTIAAAAISYFSLFSIFPILLLSITIASLNFNALLGWRLIIQTFEFIAPALNQLLGENIVMIIEMRGPITGVALLTLLWSGSSVFYILTQTLNDIWAVGHIRPVWKRRGLAILLVLAIVGPLLFLASFAGSLIDTLRSLLPAQLLVLGKGISFVVAILLDVSLFLALYNLLPHGQASWREMLPGAIAAGVLWELAKKAFLLFVASYVNASNLVYGSLAAIVAFLTWAYLSGVIFMFGAYVSLATHQLMLRRLGEDEG
jgi:membrane protein